MPTVEERAKNRAWLLKQVKLSLDELIKEPNCGFHCPAGKKFFCCGGCVEHKGFYIKGEMAERGFTEKERKFISESWNNTTGWLDDKGCVLPRRLRSKECLRALCNRYEKDTSNGSFTG